MENCRYVPEASLRNITTQWKGLRWAMPSKVFIAPLLSKQIQKDPYDSKGTHTRLPEGRHVTSILPGKEVGTCARKRDR